MRVNTEALTARLDHLSDTLSYANDPDDHDQTIIAIDDGLKELKAFEKHLLKLRAKAQAKQ